MTSPQDFASVDTHKVWLQDAERCQQFSTQHVKTTAGYKSHKTNASTLWSNVCTVCRARALLAGVQACQKQGSTRLCTHEAVMPGIWLWRHRRISQWKLKGLCTHQAVMPGTLIWQHRRISKWKLKRWSRHLHLQTGKVTPNMQISKHSNCIYSAVSSLRCLEVNNLLWSKSYISVSGVPMCQRRPFAAVNIKICVETSCICHRTMIPLYGSMNASLDWHTVHQSC